MIGLRSKYKDKNIEMSRYKIIEDYSHLGDTELAIQAKSGIKGLTGNTRFTFVNGELVAVVTEEALFNGFLVDIATGDKTSVPIKNKSRVSLLIKIGKLCKETNVQANGDETPLLTTGFPLIKIPSHIMMGDVKNFQVSRGKSAGTIELSVDKPDYNHNGTVFAYWDPALGVAPTDINKWFHRHSNSHSMTLTGLAIGKVYQFASAYKGNDADALVWSAIVSIMIGD